MNYWNELPVKEGLTLKTHKLMILTSLQQEFLKDLHIGHLEEEMTLPQVQDCMHWPGVTEDVKQYIRKCGICQSIRPNQQNHMIFPVVHQKAGNDLFQHKSHEYWQFMST